MDAAHVQNTDGLPTFCAHSMTHRVRRTWNCQASLSCPRCRHKGRYAVNAAETADHIGSAKGDATDVDLEDYH